MGPQGGRGLQGAGSRAAALGARGGPAEPAGEAGGGGRRVVGRLGSPWERLGGDLDKINK